MKRTETKKELKPGQFVWDGTDVVIYQHSIEDEGTWSVNSLGEESHYTNIKPTPLTRVEIQDYLFMLGWVFEGSYGHFTKPDGESDFYIEKYRDKWVLTLPPTIHEGEIGDGYWASDEDFDSTIEFLKEAKFIINGLNNSL